MSMHVCTTVDMWLSNTPASFTSRTALQITGNACFYHEIQQLFILITWSNQVCGYMHAVLSIQPQVAMSMWMLHIGPWSEQTANTHKLSGHTKLMTVIVLNPGFTSTVRLFIHRASRLWIMQPAGSAPDLVYVGRNEAQQTLSLSLVPSWHLPRWQRKREWLC